MMANDVKSKYYSGEGELVVGAKYFRSVVDEVNNWSSEDCFDVDGVVS